MLLIPETIERLIGRGVKVDTGADTLILRKGFISVILKVDYWRDGLVCFRIVKGKLLMRILSMLGIVPSGGGRLCLDFSRDYPGMVVEDARVTDRGLLLHITFEEGRELGF